MKTSILTIRAIGAEFAESLFKSASLTAIIASILLIALTVWLTSMNGWWWLLCWLFIMAILVGFILLFIAKKIITAIRPSMTPEQKAMAKSLAQRIESASDVAQVPRIPLLLKVIRDVRQPHEDGFIAMLSTETAGLKNDVIALNKSFEQQ